MQFTHLFAAGLSLTFVSARAPSAEGDGCFETTTNPGDTCESFARQWRITVDELKMWNPTIPCPEMDPYESNPIYCVNPDTDYDPYATKSRTTTDFDAPATGLINSPVTIPASATPSTTAIVSSTTSDASTASGTTSGAASETASETASGTASGTASEPASSTAPGASNGVTITSPRSLEWFLIVASLTISLRALVAAI